MMDFMTLSLLGALFMGLMAGDAAISSNTMSVNVGLPPIVQNSGLTRRAAEEIFVTEIARIVSVPSVVPVPTPRVASRGTLIGALAEPLKLTGLTAALQDLFGLEHVRISATMLHVEAGLRLEIVVSDHGKPLRLLELTQPNLNAVELLRRGAREAFAEVVPYQVILAQLNDFLDGAQTDLSGVRATTSTMLGRNWTRDDHVEHSALLNLNAVLFLLEGDPAQAAREVQLADSLLSTRSIHALNAAFLSILSGDLEQARAQTERGIALSRREPPFIRPYVLIQRGLLAWAEGKREVALQLMQEALQVEPDNRNARSYVAWLQHLNSGAPGHFDPASLPRPLNRTQMIPALMASVFLQEPLARQIHRASSR
ncbi:hypothetical protein [Rhodovarius sp.]|uniref:tetratricopeptide repeat protein n=1 Tax=Rhodovarius sp. TaxID=2972673 RepID=UPI0033413DED